MYDMWQYVEQLHGPDATDLSYPKKVLSKALEDILTEKQKRYMFLYYGQLYTMQQIADMEGVSKPTISRTLKRARIRAHKVLKFTHPAFLK